MILIYLKRIQTLRMQILIRNVKILILILVLRDRISIYTLFLNPKGKLITDAFIYRPKVFENGITSFR